MGPLLHRQSMFAHTGLLVSIQPMMATGSGGELGAHPGRPMVASTIPSVISSLGSASRDLADAIAIHLHSSRDGCKHPVCWP